ncbi:MAG TPA: MMPL family transporter [Dehalococcoidia bacterium]|nr:MMPL family transporter [Dehalococcoidia bacterium]
MLSLFSPKSLARSSARHPWLTIAFWVVLVAAGVFAAGSTRVDDSQQIHGSESQRAHTLLEQLRGPAPATETVVVQSNDGATVDDPAYRSFVTALTEKLRALDGSVASAQSFWDTHDPAMVSSDRKETIIAVGLTGKMEDAEKTVRPLLDTVKEAGGGQFRVLTAGDGSITRDLNHTAEKDLAKGEMVGIPAAIIILVFVFGAAVAAGVPVVLGLLGIALAVGLTAVISQVVKVNSVTTNMITMIGLAVGIDYTLFIVERFREERARGAAKIDAISTAADTAGRAVLFSGITVMIALAGLFIVPSSIFHALSIGALTAVIAAVALAMTLLPAVLSLLDRKLDWLRLPGRKAARTHEEEGGFWGRQTAIVMRHPLLSLVLAAGVLIAAAAPVATIKLGNPGLTQMPGKLQSVQAFKVLDRDFSAGRLSPTDIVVQGDITSADVQWGIARLRQSLNSDPAIGGTGALEVSEDGTLANLPVTINGDPSSNEAREMVQRIRNEHVPAAFRGIDAKVSVGGGSAETEDYISTMNTYLPIVMAFVLTLSFVLLTVVFRSLVIPVKAIVMNLLSVGAAYGLLVAVFQHGIGADLLGFQQTDIITAWLPVFLFTVLFGLSMDYHVFLLTRVQERYLHTRDNKAAVGYGLRSTAHIITGAAAIMMAVFAGFALGDQVELQQMGFGLAVAVFIDATIVRSILVPASMAMLGEWNWYLPSWLRWLPTINVEGGARRAAAPQWSPAPGAGLVEGVPMARE